MKRTEYITYNDVEITVNGYYSAATFGSYDEPSYPAEFEIDEIFVGKEKITGIFTDDQSIEIEEQILNND